jgi:lysophospholipase L1-like esterase
MAAREELFRFFRFVFLAVLCTAPGITVTASGAVTQSFRVVILGSSTAAGAGASPLDSSWVNRYARYLTTVFSAPDVVNLAVGGQTTFNIMPTDFAPPSPWNVAKYYPKPLHNITRALQLYPNLIIINLPTNDCVDDIPVDRQIANYDRILQDANSAGIPVWIATSQPRNLDQAHRTLLQQLRSAIMNRYGGRAIDFWTGLADASGFILPQYNADGTHLNNAGHQVLFGRVVNAIPFQPPLTATPNAVDFGSVRLGATDTRTVTLANSASSAIIVDAIKTAHWLFDLDRSSAVVPPYGSIDIHVTYAPQSYWFRRDTLLIRSTTGGASLQIPLIGVSPAPTVDASPGDLDFGMAALQTSRVLTVTLGTSSVNDASVDSVSFSRPGFSITPAYGMITASSPLTLSVTFAPGSFGEYTDTLRIRGGFHNSDLFVPVRGQSPAPSFVLSRDQVAFPWMRKGATAVQRVMLQNGGSHPLTVLSFSAKTRHFSVPTATPALVNGADSMAFEIRFQPDTTGEMRDTIAVVTNAGVKTVVVSGTTPVPVLVASTAALEFGTVAAGTTLWRSVALRVKPYADTLRVRIDSVRVRRAGFTIDGPGSPATLTQSDSIVVRVGFSPVHQLVYRDTLRIYNSTYYSIVDVPLSGACNASSTSIQAATEIPDRTLLLQNYPNPFNPSTTIRYNVPGEKNGSGVSGLGSGHVRLAVYDLLGQEVAVLVDGVKTPGRYSVEFSVAGSGLPSGVYYYRLVSGQTRDVKTMLLVR